MKQNIDYKLNSIYNVNVGAGNNCDVSRTPIDINVDTIYYCISVKSLNN